jgi:CubicO group peptidase (beta-lactamase class C family)
VAIYQRGEKVVDLVGGFFDEERTVPYNESTLQLVFSTTKGIVAIALAMCVERGWLRYDDRVATRHLPVGRMGFMTLAGRPVPRP